MKKIMLLLIMLFCVTHCSYASKKAFIKVCVASDQQKGIFLFSHGFIIQDDNGKKYSYNFSTLNITASSNSFLFGGKSIRSRKIKIFPKKGYFGFNGRKYRGSIYLLKSGKYSFHVINVLHIEEYLYGVLKSEMLANSPFQALCAQAVVARTWAMRNIGRHASDGYDVCNTTHCQVYGGMSAEHAQTNKAVDHTRGIVLRSNGMFINAVYHCNCGGHTANNEDIWNGKPLDYLRGVKCHYCMNSDHYIWSLKVKASLFNEKMNTYLKIANIKHITISNRTSQGFVTQLKIQTGQKQYTVSGNDFRRAMGSKILPSSKFFFSQHPDTSNTLSTILNDLGTVSSTEADPIKAIINQYEKKYENNNTDECVVEHAQYVHFSGYGFGHGLGLCQEGACGMALEGHSYKDILYHYYGKNIAFSKIK